METNGTKQGDTPRTDEAVVSPAFIAREMDHYKHKFVLADVSREIERENADLLLTLQRISANAAESPEWIRRQCDEAIARATGAA